MKQTMREITRNPLIDPEPFTVIVGVAGIVGGVASVFATYKAYAKNSPVKARRTALDLSNQAVDELLGLAADLDTIEAILAKAEISGDRKFRPETVAFLREKEFSRYEDATDSMYGRLRTLLRITNKLDRQLPRLPEVRVVAAAKEISEVQDR